ncbi:GNAT family N-acetyltransferase [Massilia sp. GER05]|uniref:GNAT family N-acetyltransferase n=1 Tax=Massilia sp. GER05 TaxID=3394605 RepID=UPI003F82CDB3
MMAIRSLGTSPRALPAPWEARPRAARCPDRFELNVATAYHDRPDILAAWHRMLAAAAGPETLYQSPQFFNHLIDMDQGRDANHELFLVRRSVDYAIVGFIPVRILPCRIAFHAGPVPLFGRTLRACQILGSVPLLDPAEPGLAEFIARQLLVRFAQCHVLYLQAVPQDGWKGIAGVAAYVLNGWRACHTQPLPDGVDAYLKHFSAKKRYNLSRQVRLLTEAAGPLHVLRIDQPGQVGAMLDAMVATDASRAAGRAGEQARLQSLARHGLLLSYVIRCGENDVAVVYGMRSASVLACLQDPVPAGLYASVGRHQRDPPGRAGRAGPLHVRPYRLRLRHAARGIPLHARAGDARPGPAAPRAQPDGLAAERPRPVRCAERRADPPGEAVPEMTVIVAHLHLNPR